MFKHPHYGLNIGLPTVPVLPGPSWNHPDIPDPYEIAPESSYVYSLPDFAQLSGLNSNS